MEENKGAVVAMQQLIANNHWQAEFNRVLGENAGTFTASLMECVTNDMQLRKCDQTAVIKEAYKAATLKLPLNKQLGSAYIIVFNNFDKERKVSVPTPTLVIGYKGYMQLAIRTGQYKTINTDVVYEGELVSWNKLTGDVDLSGEKKSDKIVGYVAYIELTGGFRKASYMSLEEMAKYALRYSPSFRTKTKPSYKDLMESAQKQVNDGVAGNGVGWLADFNSMACKTVLKKLISKYGPISIEMQNVETSDDVYNEQDNKVVRDEITSEKKDDFDVDSMVDDAEVISEETSQEDIKNPAKAPKGFTSVVTNTEETIAKQKEEVESLFS